MPFFFSGLPTFLEAFTPLGVKIQRKIHPQVPMSGMWTVGEMLCCLYICTWPVLKTISTTAASGIYPLSRPMMVFYNPPRPNISGHQDSKSPSSNEQQPCAENSFRGSPPLPPGFLCSWMFALSYLTGEFCYLCEMWPGSARECLWRNITGTHRDNG